MKEKVKVFLIALAETAITFGAIAWVVFQWCRL